MKRIELTILLAFILAFIISINLMNSASKKHISSNITIKGKSIAIINMYDNYNEENINYLGMNYFNKPIIEGKVDINKKGIYILKYSPSNFSNQVIKRFVIVKDKTDPVITLKGESIVNLKLYQSYKDEGYIAIDNTDGNITNKVKVTSNLNNKIPGVYKITYTVSDSSGNIRTINRIVNVQIKGSRYIVISIKKQKLWFYKNNKLFLETSIVTGFKGKSDTYQGNFKIIYKDTNTRLKTKEYDVPVAYWMQFKAGQGLHDANWRSKFGGSIYKNNGSHGCINLPFWAAKNIYNNTSVGTPVFIY